MKKFFIFFTVLFLFFHTVLAHPLDISSSFLSFHKKFLHVTTYFHSYEIEYLLNAKNKQIKSVYQYYDYTDIIKQYVQENIYLKIEENPCKITHFELLPLEEYQILTTGLEVNYTFECENDIESGELQISFFDNFPLQTNQATFYNLNSSDNTPFDTMVFTSKIQNYTFHLQDEKYVCIVDSDGDGIPDEQELIYKTDPFSIDTDGDFYTDYEEIFYSFDPLDKNLGPNQAPREKIPEDILKKIEKNIKTLSDCEEELQQMKKQSDDNKLLTAGFGNEYFLETLKKISQYIHNIGTYNIFFILLVVVGLGFIHALGPGHSKSLLISYILDKNKTFFDGFLFVIIFTVTHIFDIVILFFVTKVLFHFYDVSNYMLYIQRVSLIILFLFSIYLIYRSVQYVVLKKESKDKKRDIKGSILLGFISGLAPCTFGWSIFLLLFSTGNIALITPLIGALALGIFLCLMCILTLTFILRKKIFERLSLFSRYSSLLSSSILFLLSIYLFFNLY